MRFEYQSLIVLGIAILLRILVELYNQKNSFLHRLIIGSLQIICIAGVNILMVVSLLPSMGYSEFVPIVCTAISCLIGIFVHFMNLLGTKKHPLTETQKAELMDL